MLRFKSLASGSSGNVALVQVTAGASCTQVLIDCGLPQRTLEQRLAIAGVALADIDAIFITHEHSDHVGHAHAISRRNRIPVYMSRGTWAATGEPDYAGYLHLVSDHEALQIKDAELLPFTVPHDAKEPLQLRVSDGAKRLGILTDLGHASSHVLESLAQCDALYLECNHDPDMLAVSKYPPFLRARVGGDYGHLSNAQAAQILERLMQPRLQHVVAAHLSQQNNRPEHASHALAAVLNCTQDEVVVATQDAGCGWITC